MLVGNFSSAHPAFTLSIWVQALESERLRNFGEGQVYAKPAFGGPAQVLRYLGRHTYRVAISNHRLLVFDGERVTFRWKDYANGNRQRKMTLSATEFLRRFVQHVLPRGFVRIRQFGLLANRCRKAFCRNYWCPCRYRSSLVFFSSATDHRF